MFKKISAALQIIRQPATAAPAGVFASGIFTSGIFVAGIFVAGILAAGTFTLGVLTAGMFASEAFAAERAAPDAEAMRYDILEKIFPAPVPPSSEEMNDGGRIPTENATMDIRSAFIEAAKGNWDPALTLINSEGFSGPFSPPLSSETLLHLAAEQDKVYIIANLLDKGADINAQDFSGATPLARALFVKKSRDAAIYLITRGADINLKMNKGNTGSAPLHLASSIKSDWPVAFSLLRAGADVNAVDSRRRTALHIAAASGNTVLLPRLIDAGADLNKRDEDALTALDAAYIENRMSAVKILLSSGASLKNSRLIDWRALFIAAVDFSHPSLAETLLRPPHSHSADARDSFNKTSVLHYYTDSPTLLEAADISLERLVQSGVKVNGQDRQGQTALHYAVCMSNHRAAEELLRAGADPDLENQAGASPLYIAHVRGDSQIVQALKNAGGSLSFWNKMRATLTPVSLSPTCNIFLENDRI